MSNERAAEPRRSEAAKWPFRKYKLGVEPNVDSLERSTINERLAQVWPLTLAAWSDAGLEIPTYKREDARAGSSRES